MTPREARVGGGEAEATAAYEYVPGTAAQGADLLAVLSVFVPEEESGDDPEP